VIAADDDLSVGVDVFECSPEHPVSPGSRGDENLNERDAGDVFLAPVGAEMLWVEPDFPFVSERDSECDEYPLNLMTRGGVLEAYFGRCGVAGDEGSSRESGLPASHGVRPVTTERSVPLVDVVSTFRAGLADR
jgi:hypothetical protein